MVLPRPGATNLAGLTRSYAQRDFDTPRIDKALIRSVAHAIVVRTSPCRLPQLDCHELFLVPWSDIYLGPIPKVMQTSHSCHRRVNWTLDQASRTHDVSTDMSTPTGRMSLSDRNCLWRIALALAALGLFALPCRAAQAQNVATDGCEIDTFALEAPRVRALLEQASSAETGRDQPINPELAAVLYCEAASYGSLEAQYRLGKMILAGRGMRRDVSTAATLFSIAADNGHQGARSMLLLTGEHVPQLPRCLSDFQTSRRPYVAPRSTELRLEFSIHSYNAIRDK